MMKRVMVGIMLLSVMLTAGITTAGVFNRPKGDSRFQELSVARQPLPSVELDNEFTTIKNWLNGQTTFTQNVSEWALFQAAVTYVSATQFTVTGNSTDIFQVARGIRANLNGTYVYSLVEAASYNAGTGKTTVTLTDGVLTSALTQIHCSLLPANTAANVQPMTAGLVMASAFANFSTAKSSPVTAGKTILVSSATTVNTITIPSDRAVKVIKGGQIAVNSGKTLTINGPFEAGAYQVFTGSGSVSFGVGSVAEISPQWWGAVGDGATDCTTAIQTALDVAHNSGIGAVFVPPGTYLSGSINWPGNNITLRGSSSAYSYNSAATPRTIFKAKTGTSIVFDMTQTGGAEDRTGNHLVDFEVNGNAIAGVGIECAGSNLVERVRVRGCTTAGIQLANFTNGTRLIHCALNQNTGWGLQVGGTSTTTYSVTDTNTSLNTLGGINLEAGVLVKFDNVISESNAGPGLRMYKPNTHLNAMEGFDFINCWFEDNAATAPNFVLVIDAGTGLATSGPQRVRFNQCRFTASVSTRKYANIAVAKWVEFDRCQFDNSSANDAVTLSSNAYYVSFINSTRGTGLSGISDTQMDNAMAQGYLCWWFDEGVRRVVDAGAPAAAFQNGWVNYGAGFTSLGYRFSRDGRVCVEGQVKSGTIGLAVFTLPVGYRPSSQKAFASDGNGAHSLVYVTPAGEVQVNVGNTTFQSLHGICFWRD